MISLQYLLFRVVTEICQQIEESELQDLVSQPGNQALHDLLGVTGAETVYQSHRRFEEPIDLPDKDLCTDISHSISHRFLHFLMLEDYHLTYIKGHAFWLLYFFHDELM